MNDLPCSTTPDEDAKSTLEPSNPSTIRKSAVDFLKAATERRRRNMSGAAETTAAWGEGGPITIAQYKALMTQLSECNKTMKMFRQVENALFTRIAYLEQQNLNLRNQLQAKQSLILQSISRINDKTDVLEDMLADVEEAAFRLEMKVDKELEHQDDSDSDAEDEGDSTPVKPENQGGKPAIVSSTAPSPSSTPKGHHTCEPRIIGYYRDDQTYISFHVSNTAQSQSHRALPHYGRGFTPIHTSPLQPNEQFVPTSNTGTPPPMYCPSAATQAHQQTAGELTGQETKSEELNKNESMDVDSEEKDKEQAHANPATP